MGGSMLRMIAFLGILILGASAAPAVTIDDQGAQAIRDALAAYFGRTVFDETILSITPQGDAYRIAFDWNAAVAAVSVPGLSLQAEPWVMRAAPAADGAWDLSTDGAPAFAVNWTGPTGPQTMEVKAGENHYVCTFDPALGLCRTAHGTATGVISNVRSPDGQTVASYGPMTVDVQSRPEGDGDISTTVHQVFESVQESISEHGEDTPPIEVQVSTGRTSMDSSIDSLRSRAFRDLWAFLVQKGDKASIIAGQEELREKLLAALPLWKRLSGSAEVADIRAMTAFGSFGLETVTESGSFSGLTPGAGMSFEMQLAGFSYPVDLVPAWGVALVPSQIDFGMSLAGPDLDAIARYAIRNADLGEAEPFSPIETATLAGMVTSGPATLTLEKTHIIAPAADLSLSGEVQLSNLSPAGSLTIDAVDFERTVSAVKAAATQNSEFQQFAATVDHAQHLGRAIDPHMTRWVIDLAADGRVSVNGEGIKPADR